MKIVVFMLCLASLTQAWAATSIGKVTKLRGDVKNTAGAPVVVNSDVFVGDTFSTGPASFIRIKLDDGVAMQAGPGSQLKIATSESKTSTTIELLRGNLLSKIRPGQKEERYRVKTPNAVMGVRGTTFFVEEDGTHPTFLCVCEGNVAVHSKKGEKLIKSKTHTPVSVDAQGSVVGNVPVVKEHGDNLGLADELF